MALEDGIQTSNHVSLMVYFLSLYLFFKLLFGHSLSLLCVEETL